MRGFREGLDAQHNKAAEGWDVQGYCYDLETVNKLQWPKKWLMELADAAAVATLQMHPLLRVLQMQPRLRRLHL